MSHARHTEEIAARWLLRQQEDGWSADDQTELDAWLDAAAEHKVAYWRLEHGWSKVDRLAALKSPSAAPRRISRLRGFWRPVAVAASVAACLAVGAAVWSVPGLFQAKDFHTDIGVRETVPLADGSKVELNTQTRLRTAVTRRTREVWLDRGEAYFEVAHDASRPFVVHAGAKTVTVLGTKFSVRRNGDQVEVAVVEGRVRVADASWPAVTPPPVLTRGDTAIAAGPSMIVAAKSVERVANELSWREGVLTFDQSTLADAAGEFNRYNRKKLVIADGPTAQMRIGGSFEAENVEAFARLLQQAYGLRVDDTGETVKISQ
ncbi:FecR family protein [Phenylobacterium sp.]|jgi:transmembrane sensor|uniref:FecR family protein n=1 Tax=Phenylobacterium sp. TaxID=1871053 RepID=UPI002E376F6A|nr:FecR domain-containing protein [Phenylobacterium sp.]HEX3363906.1 FecR domain-containing protein [Phenylobacterium sp.]